MNEMTDYLRTPYRHWQIGVRPPTDMVQLNLECMGSAADMEGTPNQRDDCN